MCWEEGTLYIEDLFREIGRIMDSRDRFPHSFFEFRYSACFDRESCCLAMTAISDKKMLAFIEELDQIAPLRSTTGSDGHKSVGLFCSPPDKGGRGVGF